MASDAPAGGCGAESHHHMLIAAPGASARRRLRRGCRAVLSFGVIGVIGVAWSCNRDVSAPASVHLTCQPTELDLQCQLVALSLDVRLAAKDVTAEASWHLSPSHVARLVAPGVVQRLADGDLDVDAQYQSEHAHAAVQFRGDAPPQLLGVCADTCS